MTTSSAEFLKKLLLVFLSIAALYYGRIFLIPLVTGAVLAALFLPFCKWMEKKKIIRGVAVMICLLSLLLVFAGVAAMVSWQIAELSNDADLLRQKASTALNNIKNYIYVHFGISPGAQQKMLENEQPSASGVVSFVAGSLTGIFYTFILMLVYFFLLLFYRNHIHDFLLKLFPPGQQKEMQHVISSSANVSQQYLVGLAKMIFCLWIMYSIGFSIAGVNNAIFFAVLCGLLEIVPFIGNITGTTITVLVSAAHGASFGMIIGIVATYAVVQFIQGWILEPIIVGPQVRINPMATIIALVLGDLLWGIPGIILAIPLTAVLKIVCDHIEPLKPYGFLIGEVKKKKSESNLQNKLKKWFGKKS